MVSIASSIVARWGRRPNAGPELEVALPSILEDGSSYEPSSPLNKGQKETTIGRMRTLKLTASGLVADQERSPDDADVARSRSQSDLSKSSQPFSSSALIDRIWEYNKAGKQQRIEAGKGVTETYHDSFLYAPMPLNLRLRASLRGERFVLTSSIVECLVSALAVGLYIKFTYRPEEPYWYSSLEVAIAMFYVVNYLLKLYTAPVRTFYLLSPTGILDLLTVVPVIFAFQFRRFRKYNVIQVVRFLRVLRIVYPLQQMGLLGGAVAQQMTFLFVYIIQIVFISAALFQYAETYHAPQGVDCPPSGCVNFFTAFYFIIVTISTVGYGDVTPDSTLGRVVVIGVILTALLVIPKQVNEIVSVASRRPSGGSFAVRKVVASRYIILSGNLSFKTIQKFLATFFHPNHDADLAAFPIRVVIMAPYRPSYELQALLALYGEFVEFIEGIPFRPEDLDRVSARAASAIFVLADKHHQDTQAEDAAQMVRAHVVDGYCRRNTRVICHLLRPDNLINAWWDDSHGRVEVICPEELRLRILARSCFLKGLVPFLVNLFTPAPPADTHPVYPWMEEYYHSVTQGVYPVLLARCFTGMLFDEVAEFVYRQYGITLFALDMLLNDKGEREVFLYPRGHIILTSDVGLVLAPSIKAAEQISSTGLKETHEQRKRKGDTADSLCWCTWCSGKRKKRVRREEAGQLMASISRKWDQTRGWESVRQPKSGTSTLHAAEGHEMHTALGNVEQVKHLRVAIKHTQRRRARESLPADDAGVSSNQVPEECAWHEVSQVKDLEEAVEHLLAWPPVKNYGKPHPAVIEKREKEILENLAQRTLTVVNSAEPIILVCCQAEPSEGLYYFVSQLRDGHAPFRPIVLLHPQELTAKTWGGLGLFEGVYFVKGSPLYELDLLRAGVLQAEKIVILGEDFGQDLGQQEARADGELRQGLASRRYMNDVNNVIATATIERLPRDEQSQKAPEDSGPSLPEWHGRILVELHREASFLFISPKLAIPRTTFTRTGLKKDLNAIYLFAPPYAAGRVFCADMLECLVAATFYNKQVIKIVHQLLMGGPIEDLGEDDGNDEPHRLLEQVAVPREYVNESYQDLFVGMLHDYNMLPVGLYRAYGTLGGPLSYVLTNPSPDVRVQKDDLVFVLK